jgi:hypothetical protein
MADWVNIDPETLLPGDPWTSAKALAALENPVAMAEGAEDAPKIAPAATGFFIGDTRDTTYDGLDRVDKVAVMMSGVQSSQVDGGTTSSFRYRLSSNGGSTWGSWVTLMTWPARSSDTDPVSAPAAVTATIDVSAHNAIQIGTSGQALGNFHACVFGILGTTP